MATFNRGFLLSYQADSHLYARLNVKKAIVTALVKAKAKQLQSYTDSTIYFELLLENSSAPADCKKILIDKFKGEKITLKYTIATLWHFTENKMSTFDSGEGDQDLNIHFKKIVESVRSELKIPE